MFCHSENYSPLLLVCPIWQTVQRSKFEHLVSLSATNFRSVKYVESDFDPLNNHVVYWIV